MDNKTYGIEIQAKVDKFKANLQSAMQQVDKTKAKFQEMSNQFKTGLKFDEQKTTAGLEYLKNQMQKTGADAEQLAQRISSTKSVLETIQTPAGKIGQAFGTAINNAKTGFSQLGQLIGSGVKDSVVSLGNGIKNVLGKSVNFAKNGFKSLGKSILNAGKHLIGFGNKQKGLSGTINKSVAGMKRFVLAIFGVQGAYMAVRRAMSSYMSMDNELQQSLQNTWAGFGSFLAPVLEYLIGMFQKLLAYVNAVVTALTGMNFVARANSKAMKQAGKSASSANKALAGFDELNNINQDSGAGGGGAGANQIELPEVDSSALVDFANKLKELFKEGKYFEMGEMIGKAITDSLAKIPWDSIKEKAGQIGKGLAEFLNGAVAGIDWKVIGNTLAQGLNTIIEFAYNFFTTFDFSSLGAGIGTAIQTFFTNIDWEKLADTVTEMALAIPETFIGLFENLDAVQIATNIETFFKKIKWGKIAETIMKALGEGLATAVIFLGTFIVDMWDSVKAYFDEWIDKAEEQGGNIWDGILMGIDNALKNIGYWLADHVLTPFIDGFKKIFGIHSPSKVMADIGKLLIDGLKQGLSNIWSSVKSIFDGLKTNITNAFTNIKTAVVNVINTLKSSMSTAWNGIWNVIKGVLNNIINGVEKMCNAVIKGLNGLLKPLTKVGNKILEAVGIKSFSFSTIGNLSLPRLKIGTDMVKQEGLAYLHAGEKVVPADVVKGGYSGGDNEETNSLLRQLIDLIDSKDYQPTIGISDIGQASVKYINQQNRIRGGAII